MLTFDKGSGRLFNRTRSECFDPGGRHWRATGEVQGSEISFVAAATWLQRESGHPLRQPIGVIGPREATVEQMAAAEAIGPL